MWTRVDLLPPSEIHTSQRAELHAAITAIEGIHYCHIRYPDIATYVVVSDSEYVVQGITNWRYKWRENGYMNAARNPLANLDLWSRVDELLEESDEFIFFWKVDRDENGEADEMAKDLLYN
jgi:ribonuclease HI